MRKASIEVSLDNFFDWMETYIQLINKTVHKDSPFSNKREKAEVLGGFVFKICARWEILVEDLLVDCLNRDSGQYASFTALRLPKHIPRPQCKAMVVGLGYLDFKNVADIKKKAKNILLEKHNPFQVIGSQDSSKIDEFYYIRNYLAHYSRVAERTLMNAYRKAHHLKTFREPGDFLLSYDKKVNGPRMQTYINSFIAAAEAMEKSMGL